MSTCDFSERDYESSYGSELRRGKVSSRTVFSPSQPLEKVLGFDSAASPDANHKIWQILKVPAPKGVTLQPTNWPNDQVVIPAQKLPTWPVSLMMQFKIPDHLKGTTRSKQHKLWKGDPYYRFATDADQHTILRELEDRLNNACIVRYASPQFHTMQDLATHQLGCEVIDHSYHVKPSAFDYGTRGSHKVWTYALKGNKAFPNPDGDETHMDTFQNLMNLADELIGPSPDDPEQRSGATRQRTDYSELETEPDTSEPLDMSDNYIVNHFRAVAETCREIDDDLNDGITEWAQALDNVELSEFEKSFLLDYTTIQSTMAAANCRWVLIR